MSTSTSPRQGRNRKRRSQQIPRQSGDRNQLRTASSKIVKASDVHFGVEDIAKFVKAPIELINYHVQTGALPSVKVNGEARVALRHITQFFKLKPGPARM